MATGGADIGDVLRRLGKDAVVRELEGAGLKPHANRSHCPFKGCHDKADKRDTVQLYPGKRGEWRLRCHRCGTDGSLVDLLAALRQWTDAQAIAHLHGLEVPAGPPLRLVQPAPAPDADKLSPQAVQAVWDGLAPADVAGQAYLEERSLGDAVAAGLVRFAHSGHPDKTVRLWASRGRLVVALLRDVTGNARGLQARLVRAPEGKEPKISSLKGSVTGRAFFGAPHLIEASPVVVVAEGLADTLAAAGWAGPAACVVGAAGKDALPRLAEELERCDISVDGRIFVLLPQNDRPENKSRRSFEQLGQLLHRRGARVVFASAPDEYKDVALWLHAHPDTAWPPAQLARVLGGEVDDDTPAAAAQLVTPARGALPIPARVTVDAFGQNFSTLVALLDDPLHREALMGVRGDFAFNEMSGELAFDGRELEETDVTGIRLRLEGFSTPEGRKLKFSTEDIWAAMAYLSKRRRHHPIRDWLSGLEWDGVPRLEEPLARAFGQQWPGLEALLLRKWFLAAVARGMEPGCKVDTVLILRGDEGLKKSTVFKMLAGGKAFFSDSPVRIGEADGFALLRRKWIIEWPELDSMKRARDAEAIMAFLSATDDDYRPKWGRGQVSIPRSCVIVATTNEERFLKGNFNRRFWVVTVPSIDFVWLKANREQLWAEAAHLYREASTCALCAPTFPDERCEMHRWWLEPEVEKQLRQHNTQHQEADGWVDVVRDWLRRERPAAVQVHRVLLEAIGKPAGQWNRIDQMRATEALKKLGWTGPLRRWGGQVGRWWVAPENEVAEAENEG